MTKKKNSGHKTLNDQKGYADTTEFDKFKFIASNLLKSNTPIKEKHIRCNQATFINKELRKEIMTRTHLLNELR